MRDLSHTPAAALLLVLILPALVAAQGPDASRGPGPRLGLGVADLHGGTLAFAAGASVRSQDEDDEGVEAEPEEVEAVDEEDASPFSFGLNYAIYSDYVFRGVNFSEHEREGREKLNHQLEAWVDIDLALLLGSEAESLGTLTMGSWFEWYGDQKKLDPEYGGHNLQEVDYYLAWAYECEPVATTFTLGYNFYTLPNLKSYNAHEWYFQLEHNDAWMWTWLWAENEEGVLSPSFYFAQDLDVTPGAIWMEVGFSHEFELSEYVYLTPSYTIAIDHRYLDAVVETEQTGSTRLAYMQYGLNIDFDMSGAFDWPEEVGGWTLSAFLYFNDVLGRVKDKDVIEDELFGGVSIEWSF